MIGSWPLYNRQVGWRGRGLGTCPQIFTESLWCFRLSFVS